MKLLGRLTYASIVFLCVTSLGIAGHSSTTQPAAPVDLGTLGGSSSQANAVSFFGSIAGVANVYGDTAQHAFLLTPGSTTLEDLGTLSGGTNSTATSVNVQNQVAGYSDYDDPLNGIVTHGFLYHRGVLSDVGTLGGAISQATALNNLGSVVGFSLLSDEATTRAFIYCPEEKSITDLGVLRGGNNSAAYGVNDVGFAVGSSETGAVDPFGSSIVDAVIFNRWNKSIVDIGNLGGSNAQATAVNDFVAVVGFSSAPDGNVHGFYWNGGKLIDIGTLGGGYTQPTAINFFGEVVGFSNITGNTNTHAFVWTKKTGIIDLNSVLPANSGWELNAAYGVSPAGEIVGAGIHNGESHGFSFKYPLH
jgi:probable HAF family extracellular repeat protein